LDEPPVYFQAYEGASHEIKMESANADT
jgi:hypothetical protein